MNKSDKKAKFDLEEQIYSLLSAEPFYAGISRYVQKVKDYRIPTAGVYIDNSANFVMLYNPTFFEGICKEYQIGILKHEFLHLVLGHLTHRKIADENNKYYYKLWNIATDLAINSMISKEMPETCLFPGKGEFKNYKPGRCAEEYYNKLKKDIESIDFDNSKTIDDHGKWEDEEGDDGSGNESKKEIAGHKIGKIVQDIARECAMSNSWGSITNEMRKKIMDKIQTDINPKEILRYFIHQTIKSSYYSSIKQINKRYPYIHSGRKCQRHAKIAIGIDQSGSVSDEMQYAFFSMLESLSTIASFTVFYFDTEVDKKSIIEWKKGQKTNKFGRTLDGGTDFNAPTKFVNFNNNKFDGLIIMTDMLAPRPIRCKVQRLWVTTKDMYNICSNEIKEMKEKVIFVNVLHQG
jgi:predicted metal-dependent peptidase